MTRLGFMIAERWCGFSVILYGWVSGVVGGEGRNLQVWVVRGRLLLMGLEISGGGRFFLSAGVLAFRFWLGICSRIYVVSFFSGK